MLLMLRTYAARPWLRARALHVAALRRDGNPIDWNPRICWQVPLCFDIDYTTKTIPVRASRTVDGARRGSMGAQSIRRRSRRSPVYPTMEEELRRVCGAAVHDELAAYCRARRNG